MLSVRRPPLDYSKCNQTVTVYHVDKSGDATVYRKTVINGAFLDFRKNANVEKVGEKESNAFLLVIPQGADGKSFLPPTDYEALSDKSGYYTLAAGDKVLLGTGADITTTSAWAAFLPSTTFGLVMIKYIDPKYWRGEICHVEAGG